MCHKELLQSRAPYGIAGVVVLMLNIIQRPGFPQHAFEIVETDLEHRFVPLASVSS